MLVHGQVVIAAFGDEDANALVAQKIHELFPDRKVVQVRLRGLLHPGGRDPLRDPTSAHGLGR